MACRCPTREVVLTSELEHAELVAEGSFDLPVPPYPRRLNQEHWKIRHCLSCGQWWWMQISPGSSVTYDRNDEQLAVGSVSHSDGTALRCVDRAEAEALHAAYPDFAKAGERFQQTFPRFDYGDPPEAAKAFALLQPLLRRHPAARYLHWVLRPDVSLAHWRQADVRVAPLRQKMVGLMEKLRRGPGEPGEAAELVRMQQRCYEVRAAEADPDWHHVSMDELWTPTLAPAHVAGYERGQLIPQQRTLDAAGRARLIALQRTIEAAWSAFMREVRIPAPLVEFFLLHQQLWELAPQNLSVDPAVWDRPEALGLRLRTLIKQHGLTWSSDQALHETVERRLGLPPTADRRPRRY